MPLPSSTSAASFRPGPGNTLSASSSLPTLTRGHMAGRPGSRKPLGALPPPTVPRMPLQSSASAVSLRPVSTKALSASSSMTTLPRAQSHGSPGSRKLSASGLPRLQPSSDQPAWLPQRAFTGDGRVRPVNPDTILSADQLLYGIEREMRMGEQQSAASSRRFTPGGAAKLAAITGGRSSKALRKIVSEALGHDILREFRSRDILSNPLVDDGGEKGEGGADGAETVLDAEEALDEGIAQIVALKKHVVDNDVDGSGALDEEEFLATIGALWTDWDASSLTRLFMQVDANSDGVVTWQELVTFLLLRDSVALDATSNKYLPRSAPSAQGVPAVITHLVHLYDRDRYVSMGRDGVLGVWSASELQLLRLVPTDAGIVTDVLYSAEHKRLVLASTHAKLLLIDVTNMRTQPGGTWRLESVPHSLGKFDDTDSFGEPMPQCLIIGDQHGQIHLVEWTALLAGELTLRLTERVHDGCVERLGWVSELNGMLSCSADGTLKLSDMGDNAIRPRNVLRSPAGQPISSFVWCAAQALVATCSRCERLIHLWSPSVASPVASLVGHAAAIAQIELDDRSNQLISRAVDQSVRVWDINSNHCVQIFEGGSGASEASAMLHDRQARTIVVGQRKLARHRSIFTEEPPAAGTPSGSPTGRGAAVTQNLVGAGCNGKFNLVLAVDEAFTVHTWELDTGAAGFRFNAERDSRTHHSASTPRFTAVGFDDSGRRLLTGSQDGRVLVWNFANGQILITCLPPPGHERAPSSHAFEISAVLGFKDGPLAYFAACTWSHELWLWPDQVGDTHSIVLPCLRVFRGHTEDVLCTAFSAGLLATGSYDGTAVLWNFKSGAVRARLKHSAARGGTGGAGGPGGRAMQVRAEEHRLTPVTHLALLKGGGLPPLLVTGCGDGGARLWDTLAGTILLQLPMVRVPSDSITALSWSEESNLFVLGTDEGHVGVWSGATVLDEARGALGTGAALWPAAVASWRAHEATVLAVQVAWMGGMSYCVTAPRNGSLRLWTTRGLGVGCYGQGTWDLVKATADAESSAGATSHALTVTEGGAAAGTSAEAETPTEAAREKARKRETFLTGLTAHLTPAADLTGALVAGAGGKDGGEGVRAMPFAPRQPSKTRMAPPVVSGLPEATRAQPGGALRGGQDYGSGDDIADEPLGAPSADESTLELSAWEVAERQLKERAVARARLKLFGPSAPLPGGASGADLCVATDTFLHRKADELLAQSRPKPRTVQLHTSELGKLSFDLGTRPRISAGAELGFFPRLARSKSTLQI